MNAYQGNEMHTFRWMIGVVLTGATMGSSALTIGPVRSPVWLEQRLDIVVPVQLDSAAPSNALCATADVFFADSMVDRAQVQVTPENTDSTESVRLRITTTASVNEPVVTVALQVGCDQKVMRRFVLLPDMPVLNAPPARAETPTADAVPLPLAPASITGAAVPDASGAARAASGAVEPSTAPAPAPAVAARPKSKPRLRLEMRAPAPRTPPPAPKPVSKEGSRLALEPLHDLDERVRKLEETAVAEPAQIPASDVDRVIQLQGDIQQLLKQAADSDAKLAALRARVEQVESERSALATALGAGGVAVVIAAVTLVLWMRRRQGPEVVEDPDLDPDVKELIVDFNPVDADHWGHAPQPARVPPADRAL
jgi:hypothetical protein